MGAQHTNVFTFRAKVWLYPGAASWHFVTLPKKLSRELKSAFGVMARGWGSLPVTVVVGSVSWQTSIFPDTKAGAYLLPLKADVRKRAMIGEGDTVALRIEIRV